jgi:hypothetical protein
MQARSFTIHPTGYRVRHRQSSTAIITTTSRPPQQTAGKYNLQESHTTAVLAA